MASASATVIFENSYEVYEQGGIHQTIAEMQNIDHSNLVCILHSVPKSLNAEESNALIQEVKSQVGSIFVTDLDIAYYNSFSNTFPTFVEAVAEPRTVQEQ
jgi:hypothetical protein